MKIILFIILAICGTNLNSIQAESIANQDRASSGFAPIIIKIMNRGTNILMSISFIFILIYTIFVAIGVSFGSMEAASFIPIFWGSGIVFSGGIIAKIYYLFLS